MRKNDLIAMLSKLKGNPEVVLWNGMVGDYMPIGKLVVGELYKYEPKYYLEMIEFEIKRDKNDWNYKLTSEDIAEAMLAYKKHHKWEENQFVTAEDITKKRWKKKRVVYIDAKTTGKTYHDRLGSIEY